MTIIEMREKRAKLWNTMEGRRRMTSDDVMLVFDSKRDFDHFQRDTDYVISYRNNCKGTSVIWNLFMDIVADGWDKDNISSNAFFRHAFHAF